MIPFNNSQKLGLDLDKHIALDAGAGTGKTAVMAERYVQHLITPEQRATILLPSGPRKPLEGHGALRAPARERTELTNWPGLLPNEVVAITSETMADWATDDNAWGLDCQFAESGWSSQMNSDGELLVTPGTSQSSDATCSLKDPYDAMSNESHTWRFGQPVSFSVPGHSFNGMMYYTDSVNIESDPSLLVQNLAIGLTASQNGALGLTTNINLGSTASTDSVSLSGISPGDFKIHVMATSSGMLDWSEEFDFGLQKANTLPIITVDTDPIEGTQATWAPDGYSFMLSGTAIDPDGGEVTLSAVMCGDTTTEFSTNGDAWSVSLSVAKCVANGLTQYDVVISATDSIGAVSTEDVSVPDPNAADDSGSDTTDTTSDDSGGLPSLGMFATIVAMLGAALLLRRD